MLCINTTPSASAIDQWLEALGDDHGAYRLGTPSDIQADVVDGHMLLILLSNPQAVCAAGWVHHIIPVDCGLLGWVGFWIATHSRGRRGRCCWPLVRQCLVQAGIRVFCTASAACNVRGNVFARVCGATKVGTLPNFFQYHGDVCDVHVYCEDVRYAQVAMAQARARALPVAV